MATGVVGMISINDVDITGEHAMVLDRRSMSISFHPKIIIIRECAKNRRDRTFPSWLVYTNFSDDPRSMALHIDRVLRKCGQGTAKALRVQIDAVGLYMY